MRACSVALALVFFFAFEAHATWNLGGTDGFVGSTSTSTDWSTNAISDGAGGVYLASFHQISQPGLPTVREIRVQRMNSLGDRLWGFDGVTVNTSQALLGSRQQLVLVDGGVVVTWVQVDAGVNEAIYGQKLAPNGQAEWTAGGIELSAPYTDVSEDVQLVADNTGGFFAVWTQYPLLTDCVVQRFDTNGNAQWTSPLVLGESTVHGVATDGATGLYVTFGYPPDYFVQRVFADKSVGFIAPGVQVTSQGSFSEIAMDSDRANGAWIAFAVEGFPNPALSNVRSLRLLPTGAISDAELHGDEIAPSRDTDPHIAYAGTDGAHVAWSTQVGAAGDWEVLARRVGDPGSFVLGSNGTTDQRVRDLAYDGQNGTVIAWESVLGGSGTDIYAERLFGREWSGSLFGLQVCTVAGNQVEPVLTMHDSASGPDDVIVAWHDARVASETSHYALRIDGGSGVFGKPDPFIVAEALFDCELPDEGGCLRLPWLASDQDSARSSDPILRYGIWRAVDALPLHPPDPGLPVEEQEEWEFIESIPATQAFDYNVAVPTTRDAAPEDPAEHWFSVVAEAESGAFFASRTVLGVSHDELAPDAPEDLKVVETFGPNVRLSWLAPAQPDVEVYEVLRATEGGEDFTLVAIVAETEWAGSLPDLSESYDFYVLATDDNGNQGPMAGPVTVQASATSVGPGPSAATLELGAPSPNPFTSRFLFEIDVPSSGPVQLELYDLKGRRVRSQQLDLQRGRRVLQMSHEDDRGRELANGVYLLRVSAAAQVQTRKVSLMR